MQRNTLHIGHVMDWAATLPPQSVHALITSPPYWNLRSYLPDQHPAKADELGGEDTPTAYVARLVRVFEALRPALHESGTLWVNLGDSYAADNKWGGSTAGKHAKGLHGVDWIGRNRTNTGLPGKSLVGIPWRFAFAMQDAGWVLRSDIIWSKPNPMPESVTDRPTKSHEYVFLLSKGPRYFFDATAIAEPALRAGDIPGGDNERGLGVFGVMPHAPFNGPVPSIRNARSVWTIATAPFPGSHFATFPPELARRCIRSGSSAYGVCARCSAPWQRVVERKHYGSKAGDGDQLVQGFTRNRMGGQQFWDKEYVPPKTTGWEPTCTCATDVRPAVVADPFAGSGTTLAVAVEEGRDYFGCDLDERARGWLNGRLAKVQRRLPLDVAAD